MSSKARPAAKRTKLPFSRDELHDPALPAYSGESLKMISFPLGGIGTGTIGLGGRGQLRDWEIFNNPNLGYRPPYTMPFIFARQGRRKVARVLERQLLPPHHDSHGLRPANLPGLPRLAEALFVGTYPVARVFFEDDDLPVRVALEAFNPMIPFEAADSAIPAAVLIYRVSNRTAKAVSGSVALSMANTVGLSGAGGLGGNVNAFRRAGALRGIHMTGRRHKAGQVGHGSEALATTAGRVSYATDFDEPGWYDRGQKVWDAYSATGRAAGPTARTRPSDQRRTRIGMLAANYSLRPRATTEIVFIIAWSFPIRLAEWMLPRGRKGRPVRNHYARRFPDAWKAARYVADNLPALRERTLRFERALFDSTLPGDVLDAVSSQMSTIRTNTTMWLDSPPDKPAGRIFAFEGCGPKSGCCPMNCTHVWNYEQSLAHLYPSLERTMRLTDYQDNLHSGGAMSFRTMLPLRAGLRPWRKKLPAADGQFGTVVKAYREWRISGDRRLLKSLWPAVKKSIRFAWKGFAGWDADADGVMEGVQHNTYDIEFHGPNSMCGSLYLAALAAGAEMAQAVGDEPAADEFRRVFESGQRKLDGMLFNGRFYVQRVNTKPRPKYQHGWGCLSDQLLGQWAAHVAGLGYVLPAGHVKRALSAVFEHNFKPDLSRHESCQRVYALGDEAGLLACTWPDGRREKFPFPYSDEVWTGIEYQVAAGLIYEGLVDEGLAIVSGARARHDGVARNPWNEFECGDHYARAMSSWSLLLALSGQRYDGRSGTLTVRPVICRDDFKCLFTAADGYGSFAQRRRGKSLSVSITCLDGRVKLSALALDGPAAKVACRLNGKPLPASVEAGRGGALVRLARRVTLAAGERLSCRLT